MIDGPSGVLCCVSISQTFLKHLLFSGLIAPQKCRLWQMTDNLVLKYGQLYNGTLALNYLDHLNA